MTAFNFRLHEAAVDAIEKEIINASSWFVSHGVQDDLSALKFKIGRIHGLREALEIIEETRRKIQES